MTTPIEPCRCGNADLAVYRYDNGWRHVECDKCWYLGPGAGSVKQAIKDHNVDRAKSAIRAALEE